MESCGGTKNTGSVNGTFGRLWLVCERHKSHKKVCFSLFSPVLEGFEELGSEGEKEEKSSDVLCLLREETNYSY